MAEVTTGNFAGFIVNLEDSTSGDITLSTELVNDNVALADVLYEDVMLNTFDILPRGIRLFQLTDDNTHTSVQIEHKLNPQVGRNNPFYVRATLEYGTQAFYSPIYVLRDVAT